MMLCRTLVTAIVSAAFALPMTALAQDAGTPKPVAQAEFPLIVIPQTNAAPPVAGLVDKALIQIQPASGVPPTPTPTNDGSAAGPARAPATLPDVAPLIRLGAAAADAATDASATINPEATEVNLAVPFGPRKPAAAPIAPPQPVTWLMPLVAGADIVPTGIRVGAAMPQSGILRLTGEVAEIELRVTLPQGVSPNLPLVLALRSSVNNLPDSSELLVTVNGVASGTILLETMGSFAPRTLEVAGLQPGVNTIRLAARQTHRIFCGPEASFGIWTEVDLAQSGIPVAPSLLPLAAEGLVSALRAQSAGNGVVDILVEDDTDDRLVRDVARSIADALGYAPRLQIMSFYSEQMDPNAKARVAIVRSDAAKATLRRGAGEAIVLQIEHVGLGLPDLKTVLPAYDGASGLPALIPGEVTPLSALGAAEMVGNTHYFRRDISLLLPDDWLLLASQKAEFTLNYGFSDGLAEGSLLLFKVNGETVRLLPLDKEGGKFQPPLRIRFPSNQLDPGINTLTFEMSVPGDPGTLPCLARDSDMLVILGNSTLMVPPAPKMRQIDILASLAVMDGRDVFLPLAAGADTTRAHETAMDFSAILRPLMASARRPGVHVVGLEGIGLVPTGNTDISRRDLQKAVDLQQLMLLDNLAPELVAPELTDTGRFNLTSSPANTTNLAAAPEADGAITAKFNAVVGWLSRQTDIVHAAAFPGSMPLGDWLVGKSGRALVLQLDRSRPNDVWVIAGPDIAPLELATSLDQFRRDASHTGQTQVALLGADGTWATWSQNPPPLLYEALTFGNLRVVMGNNASWSPALFMSLSLFLALLSVVPAILFVLMTRRAGSRT